MKNEGKCDSKNKHSSDPLFVRTQSSAWCTSIAKIVELVAINLFLLIIAIR